MRAETALARLHANVKTPLTLALTVLAALPSLVPAAPADADGFVPLFNALDLRGWRTNAVTAAHWSAGQGRITLESAGGSDATLWTEREFGAAEFIVDFQPPRTSGGKVPAATTVIVRGTPVALTGADAGKFSRFVITVQGRSVRVQRDAEAPIEQALPATAPARGALGLAANSAAGAFMNLHAREL